MPLCKGTIYPIWQNNLSDALNGFSSWSGSKHNCFVAFVCISFRPCAWNHESEIAAATVIRPKNWTSLARTWSVTIAWTLTWTRVHNGVESSLDSREYVYTVSSINIEWHKDFVIFHSIKTLVFHSKHQSVLTQQLQQKWQVDVVIYHSIRA